MALYTPALSEGYIAGVERLCASNLKAVAKCVPTLDPLSGFDFSAEDLKLTNPSSSLCFYPWLLFSAGQGAKTPAKALQDNWLTQRPRDPRVVLLGDSGGFQIQQQTIGFDPSETPQRMLDWLERVADQSMILDFPTGGIESGAATPHGDQLVAEGFDVFAEAQAAGLSSDFVACLERTLRNNAHFAEHRTPGATKLLNVIQGRNDAESRRWYEQVREFPFDGWAFAGKHSTILSMTLRRLVQMKEDKLLRPGQWMHFLGISTLSVGVALTYLQRALREHTPAHDIQLSFDSKSPVDGIIFGYQAVAGFDFSPNRWSFRTEKTGIEKHRGSAAPLSELARDWSLGSLDRKLARTSVGNLVTLGDLLGRFDHPKQRYVAFDWQQTLLMHHNTQAYIEGFRAAYGYLEDKYVLERAQPIRHLSIAFNEILRSKKPEPLIDEWAPILDALSFQGSFG